MSSINQAHGGDGWSKWAIDRQKGDDVLIVVVSNAESIDGKPKVIAEEHLNDAQGRRALDRALSISAAYAARMAA